MGDAIVNAAGCMLRSGQVLWAYRFLLHAIDNRLRMIRDRQRGRLTLEDALFRIRMNDVQKRCGDNPDARAVRDLMEIYLSARRAAA